MRARVTAWIDAPCLGGGGQGEVSSPGHEPYFAISRVTKKKSANKNLKVNLLSVLKLNQATGAQLRYKLTIYFLQYQCIHDLQSRIHRIVRTDQGVT